MASSIGDRAAKRAHCGDPGVEVIIVGQVESKHDRPSRHCTLDYIESNGFAPTIDYQMFAIWRPQHANIRCVSVDDPSVYLEWPHGAHGEHARVNDC
ncbi:hypothetical protein [Sphingobium nicotianae]|uniref:Uncharacterized protein n=1 Tax=Sphingobium nicotianae TaxID=2782607 RepID=A0A9X1DG44_9SPHN|nr:hypothetical protein [Sphingobium nicotianae]MBT2189279.1 hypothetical protein [Sphingobium nicotianae]